MKNITIALLLTIATQAFAEDNMLIFSSKDIMGVVINEVPVNKIQQIFNYFQIQNTSFIKISKNRDITLSCRRGVSANAGSCTFKFIPSSEVQMQDDYLRAFSSSDNTQGIRMDSTLDITFKNISGGQFNLRMNNNEFSAEIRK